MKTRNLLFAMALPTLFAACTAEEIVSQADNNVLENRALLGDLTAKIENPVASRAAWSEESLAWGEWEADDVFSAALTDGVTAWTAGDKLYTNYVFKKNADGEWTTTSQMVEGLYSFYSYKGIATKNDRKLVAFDITNQKADLDEPTKVLDDHQLFFSPLYKIEAKNTTAENNIALPLQFYPYHSIAAFYIKNSTEQDLQISQIVAKGSFIAKGNIEPAKIQGKGFEYNVCKDGTEYKLWKTEPSATAAGVEYTAKEVKEMWEMSTLSSAAAVNQIVLDCDNWTLAEGEEVIAYMNIPAGAQTAFSVEINVVDAEGNAKTVYVQNTKARVNDEDKDADPIYSIASTGLNKTSFKRGTATAVFGLKNKQPKAIEIAEDNLADASGIYVDNEAALLDLIADGRGEIMVHNAGDLVLNSTIADALAENTACYLVFTNPIAIQDFEKTVELTKVTFKDKVTVKDEYEADGTTATEEGTTVVFGEDVNVEAGMEVEAYSTATLEAGKFNAITNKGTLIKYDGANVGNVTSTGALTADCGDAPEAEEEAASRAATAYTLAITIDGGTAKIIGFDPSVTLKGGSLEYEAEYDATAQKNKPLAVNNLTVRRDTDKNATVTIGADVTWTNNVEITELNAIKAATTSGVTSISKKLTVVNNGTITSTKYFRVGNLTNNGVINVTTAGGEYLVIFGEATNNKTINATWVQLHYGSAGLTASGTLTNNGFINGKVFSERNGKIVAKAGSAMTLKNGDSANKKSIARVDNTEGGNLGMSTEDFESTKYVIYHEYSDFNLGDLQKLNTPLFNINTIVVTGVYTVDAKDLDATLTNYSDVINRFEFKNGSSMVVASETTLFTNDNVYVEGEVTFAGWSAEKSKVLLNGSELTVAKNSVLTLRNITLDGYDASHKMELTYGAAVATTDKAGKIEKEGNAVLGQNVSND